MKSKRFLSVVVIFAIFGLVFTAEGVFGARVRREIKIPDVPRPLL